MFSKLILPLTYKCNLDCDYCYVDKTLSRLMSSKIALEAIDFLIKQNSNKKKFVSLIFTGGEPLLEWGRMIKIISYAKKKAQKHKVELREIGFPTNGLLLNREILEFCRRENVKVNVSLDGFLNRRTMKKGANSFLILEKKIPLLINYKDVVRLKVTVHPKCAAVFFKTFKNFFKLGFRKIDVQPAMGMAWTSKQKALYLKNLRKIFSLSFGSRAKMGMDMNNLRDFFRKRKAEKSCPKIKREFLVDVDGKIYPCEFFMALDAETRKKYCLGDVKNGVDIRKSRNCQRAKVCDNHGSLPLLKNQCSHCKQSQACYQVCLGMDIKKRSFNPLLAQNGWVFMREIEKVFEKYKKMVKE